MIVTVAAIILLRFFWPAVLMLFIFAGVDQPGTMAAVIIGLVIILAAALRERLAGRPW
jgi:hypothetical protein